MAKPSRIEPASNPAMNPNNPFSESWLTRKLHEATDCMRGKSPTEIYKDRLEAITGQRPDVGMQADASGMSGPDRPGAMRWQDDEEADDEDMADDMDGDDDADDDAGMGGGHEMDLARAAGKIVLNASMSVGEKRAKLNALLRCLDDEPADKPAKGKGDDDKADDAD